MRRMEGPTPVEALRWAKKFPAFEERRRLPTGKNSHEAEVLGSR
jgi:hypothetical protein